MSHLVLPMHPYKFPMHLYTLPIRSLLLLRASRNLASGAKTPSDRRSWPGRSGQGGWGARHSAPRNAPLGERDEEDRSGAFVRHASRAPCLLQSPASAVRRRSAICEARLSHAERAAFRVRARDQAMEHRLNTVLALGAARFPSRRARRLPSSPISAARTLHRTELCVRCRGLFCRLCDIKHFTL